LFADSGLVSIIIKNLVSNAIKFSHEGGSVDVAAWVEDKSIHFAVTDRGVGIPEAAIPQLFTKFYRVPMADAAGIQGTGLGLALVREAVLAHGGHIEVESKLGEGSRFTVTIPRQ
jgi:signal transduction histidine kinase